MDTGEDQRIPYLTRGDTDTQGDTCGYATDTTIFGNCSCRLRLLLLHRISCIHCVIHVLLIVEGKKHGKAGSSICFHRFLKLSLKLLIAGLPKKEIANSKAWVS
ncbi:uncharacterized protein [Pyrus communis]